MRWKRTTAWLHHRKICTRKLVEKLVENEASMMLPCGLVMRELSFETIWSCSTDVSSGDLTPSICLCNSPHMRIPVREKEGGVVLCDSPPPLARRPRLFPMFHAAVPGALQLHTRCTMKYYEYNCIYNAQIQAQWSQYRSDLYLPASENASLLSGHGLPAHVLHLM